MDGGGGRARKSARTVGEGEERGRPVLNGKKSKQRTFCGEERESAATAAATASAAFSPLGQIG